MKQKHISILAFILFILLIEGCASYAIRDHKASVETVNNIKEKFQKSGVKINIGSFVSSKPDIYDIECRLSGPIKPPNGISFNAYIIDALKQDMNFAGIYSEDSTITINVYFEKIDFSSISEVDKWIISARFYTSKDNYFKVIGEYKFDTSFSAYAACAQVSEEFPRAVEKYINDTISHPDFARIMNGRNF